MIRFHLDEHVPPALAVGLRNAGIDVSTSTEAGLLNASDREQLQFAYNEGRVIVTHDDDFLVLHSEGLQHAGIAYCHQEKYSIGDLLRTLLLLDACFEPEDMRGRVEFL